MKKIVTLFLVLILAVMLVGCGSSVANEMMADSASVANSIPSMNGYWKELPSEEMEESVVDAGVPEQNNFYIPAQVTKMVYTANLDLETLEFDKGLSELEALVSQMNGYFENKSISSRSAGYRYADCNIRIPSERYQEFLDQAGNLCQVVYLSEDAQNISEEYYNTASRLETAQVKLDRLQELLSRADSMADIITIESAISETEYTIERLSGTLRSYDSLVDYATVYVGLREVYELSGSTTAPVKFWQRMGSSFDDGLRAMGRFFQNLAVWLAYSWLTLLIIVAVVVIAVRVAKRKGLRIRRRKKVNDGKGIE